jgi:hypothetical protein
MKRFRVSDEGVYSGEVECGAPFICVRTLSLVGPTDVLRM